jgi:hypothetical protein
MWQGGHGPTSVLFVGGGKGGTKVSSLYVCSLG